MENKSTIIGIDVGTTTVKTVVIDTTTETILGKWSCKSNASVPSDVGPSGDEQDVIKIFSAVEHCMSCIPDILKKNVSKIGISGQMHGVVMWTKAQDHYTGELQLVHVASNLSRLSHLYTWQDGRCSEHFLASLPMPESHLRISTGFGCATIFWLSHHEPGSLEVFHCAGTVHDLLVAVLCDLDQVVMSPQNAASWGYFDTVTGSWNTDLLSSACFPVKLLPKVIKAGKSAGKTRSCWHGIPAGTPVTAALGDLQCYMLATLQHDKDAVINIGTSAQFTYLMPADFCPSTFAIEPSSPVEYVPFFSGRYLSETASLNGGNVLASFVSMLCSWQQELGLRVTEESIWQQLSSFVDDSEEIDISRNLHIEATLLGERHEPNKRGLFVYNLQPSQTSLRQFYRSLCRSLVTNLRAMSPPGDRLTHIDRIIGSGGVLAKNRLMRDEVSKLYGKPIVMIDDENSDGADSAVGAALATARYMHCSK